MGKKIKYIIIFIVAVTITATAIILLLNYINKEQNSISEVSTQTQPEQNITQTDNTLVIGIEKNEEVQEEVEEPKEETAKTPAQLTQEIYNINGPIGTLVIPKTGLNTQIYSSVIVEQMEKMPCFLYTTGGLNKTGTTLFVGHNRRNGTLFSFRYTVRQTGRHDRPRRRNIWYRSRSRSSFESPALPVGLSARRVCVLSFRFYLQRSNRLCMQWSFLRPMR